MPADTETSRAGVGSSGTGDSGTSDTGDGASKPASVESVQLRWTRDAAIVNLRGDPEEPGFVRSASAAIGLALPVRAGGCAVDAERRVVWAGPDDWFVVGPAGTQHRMAGELRAALAGHHHAVTDVSSGYQVLGLSGPRVRELLAQGCPLDLHPRAFPAGGCAGTHFFKAAVWIWRSGDDAFEVLVRSSFAGYVELMLGRCTAE